MSAGTTARAVQAAHAAQPGPERQAFYRRIEPLHLAPLWEAFGTMITKEPVQQCVPHLWRYGELRAHLLEAGALITAEEAERRVLMLENPGMPGQHCVTQSLFAGLQLVMPGEIAPCHRHAQTALRLVLEGHHAYTGVDGERIPMARGDFIVTPAWSWHDHGNESSDPVVWMDGLDIPMVKFFGASFIERYPQEIHPETRLPGQSQANWGANLRPAGRAGAGAGRNPLWHYPYARTRDALDKLRKGGEGDACHGFRMQYVNPADGGYAIATMATFIQLLPKGFSGETYRSTDGTVFCCLEGRGTTEIAGRRCAWGPSDIFVAPPWHPYRHEAQEDAVLFSFSDRAVQEKIGLWRERVGK